MLVGLQTDQVDVRLKAVELLGQLFALPGRHVAQEYRQLFSEFLKRFGDKAVEVRVAVVNCAKVCLEANPSGEQATEILSESALIFGTAVSLFFYRLRHVS